MFSSALVENTVLSCGTMPMRWRSAASEICCSGTPSSFTVPLCTS
jgi:hypothetical protein